MTISQIKEKMRGYFYCRHSQRKYLAALYYAIVGTLAEHNKNILYLQLERGRQKMKRLTTAIVILAILMTAVICAAEEKYVASRHNRPFHTLSCRWAKKISQENAVYYSTRDEAINDGHRPCKVCRP